jgi:hypothetical protein
MLIFYEICDNNMLRVVLNPTILFEKQKNMGFMRK